MPWSTAFYFGGDGGETVFVPIETIEFEAFELAAFELIEQSPAFEAATDMPIFDFTGNPVFEPIADDAEFNVQC